MQPLPDKIKTTCVNFLLDLHLPKDQINASMKWLQYYLDFCSKYHHPAAAAASLPLFLKKLEEKKQSEAQRGADEKAVSLFFQLVAELKESAARTEENASTPNQAFKALLFFYRHVLKKEYGDFSGVSRAKKSKYVPAVISRKEIDAIT